MKYRRRVLLWSAGAAILAFFAAYELYNYNQCYRQANRLATGTVVKEGYPETLGNVLGPDPRVPSIIKFHVQGKLYYRGSEHLPDVGKRVLVRYNSSNPKYNHAVGDEFNFNGAFVFAIFAFAFGWAAYIERQPEAHR
jgi:hypothetical protein